MKIARFYSLLTILILVTSLSACGGGGSGTDAGANPPTQPPVSNPPTDPTTTAEWAALAAELDSRFTTDRNNLNAEQAADNGHLDGNYYARARDRFVNYVGAFWGFAYDETLRLSNSSSVTFKQADVTALLDDYRSRWLNHVDVFVNNLPGNPGGNVLSTISSDMGAAVTSGYNNTLDRLTPWLVQWISPAMLSKVQGSWTSGQGELSFTIEPSGSVLGYDLSGCQFVGIAVTNAWLEPDFRIIMKRECGTTQQLVSGVVIMAGYGTEPSIHLDAASESSHLNILLSR